MRRNKACRIACASLCLALACSIAPGAETFETQTKRRERRERKTTEDHSQHAPRSARAARLSRTSARYDPPDVALTDMRGAKTSLAEALKHEGPLMLQFIFTTCTTICPVMSGAFSAAQTQLGPAEMEKVRMISISVDPTTDTPERLMDYARKFKAGSQWLFLTGEADDVIAAQKAFDAYRGDKMRHEPLTFLRAPDKKSWVRLDGLMSASQLVAEYRTLYGR